MSMYGLYLNIHTDMLFNDTSSPQRIFSVMYDHTLFLCLQIIRSDIRPHSKWAVSLANAELLTYRSIHFIIPVVGADLSEFD